MTHGFLLRCISRTLLCVREIYSASATMNPAVIALAGRQGALADGLNGLNPRNTGYFTHPKVSDYRWLTE